jgi:photosystem II stability/assembly factor-like uncharacterized protein
MKNHSTKLASLLLLIIFLPACGVFEMGIEQPTATPIPPTAIISTPSSTPLPVPTLLRPGQAVEIMRINMLNITNGWGIGEVETDLNDHVLYTRDRGRSWQDVTPTEALTNSPIQGLAAISFFSADGDAWVTFTSQTPQPPTAQTQKFWHSNDSGKTWQVSELPLTGIQMDYFSPFQLGFLDAQHGWLIAHVKVETNHDYVAAFATADGGGTWSRVIDSEKNPELMNCQKTGLTFSSTGNGWLAGNCPGLITGLFFYSTTNSGQTWQQAGLTPPNKQPADFFTGSAAACGIPELVYQSARTTLLTVRCDVYATKQTASWLYTGKLGVMGEGHQLPTPFGAIQFLNADEGWMVGSWRNDPSAPGGIYHTMDGGETWAELLSTAWQGTPNFINSNTGWIVARTADKVALVFSNDGGLTWEVLSPVIR